MPKRLARPFDRYAITCLTQLEADVMYQRRCFDGCKIARGRHLSEALKNDPEAPCGAPYGGSVYYSPDEIREYVESVNEGAGIVESVHPLAFPDACLPSCAAGIYFLKLNGQIIYVGQARNVLDRVQAHVTEKKFDSVDFFPCLGKDLNDLEGFFIRLLDPPDNARPYYNNGLSCPKSKLWDRIVPLHGVRSR